MTAIGASFLAPHRLAERGLTPRSIRYAQTGMLIQDEAELSDIRAHDPGGLCFIEVLRDDVETEFRFVERALQHADTIIASDAMPLTFRSTTPPPNEWPIDLRAVTHPRSAGTYARTLRLVRERALMRLSDAIARCSLMPAQVVESVAPAMRRKGRLRIGYDADITVFDPNSVTDQATYLDTTRPSRGIDHVVVNGTPVVLNGEIVSESLPGIAICGRTT